jgi:hypothetical protein
MPLTTDEMKLIGRLTADAAETAARFRRQGNIILAGAIAVAAIAALRGIWFLVPVCLLFGAGLAALGRLAAKRSGPERAAPVLQALREAPWQVKTIQHSETSDSRRMFVSHWVVVTTEDGGLLRVRANDDWQALMDQIAKRCPQATVTR